MKKINSITIHTDSFDEAVIEDTLQYCSNLYHNIHLMPDTHRGVKCPIGFVGQYDLEKGIDPHTIGIDIGCGVSYYKIPHIDIDHINWEIFYTKLLDKVYKNNSFCSNSPFYSAVGNTKFKNLSNVEKVYYIESLGTLGEGNHFIEINRGRDYDYIVVHSGSRKFGADIYKYYTSKLEFDRQGFSEELQSIEPKLRQSKIAELKEKYSQSIYSLKGEDLSNYLNDIQVATKFAEINRVAIIHTVRLLLQGLDIPIYLEVNQDNYLSCTHNYIDTTNRIIRKGSISAQKDKKVIIPINMRDGSIIGVGKGNPDWLYSAPHGAGRVLSRTQAKQQLSYQEFKDSMKDTISYSISEDIIDEAPQAYRGMEEILETIQDTVEIQEIIKPIFNFKI